jgi:hypothetical protein
MRHVVRLPAHFGSGEVLENGRQEHMPQDSENVRQSASVLQAVDVPGSALGGEDAGATASARELEGAAGAATAGAAFGGADAAGEGSCSVRLHPLARKVASAVHPAIDRRATLADPRDRRSAFRAGDTDMAAAYRQLIALTSRSAPCVSGCAKRGRWRPVRSASRMAIDSISRVNDGLLSQRRRWDSPGPAVAFTQGRGAT